MRTTATVALLVALSAPAATGDAEASLSSSDLALILQVLQICGIVALGLFLRGFVLNQAAYIQIHIHKLLREEYTPLKDFEKLEARYDPLAERVAVLEHRLGLRGAGE